MKSKRTAKARAETKTKIDGAILSACEPSWKKVAMIIGRAAKELPDLPEGDEGYRLIARRIQYLVGHGLLIAQGDIARPRYSEVRFPDENENDSAPQIDLRGPRQGSGEQCIRDWIKAASVLVENPSAEILCPKCGLAFLATEVEELDRTHFDLHLRCSNCGAHEIVYKRRP